MIRLKMSGNEKACFITAILCAVFAMVFSAAFKISGDAECAVWVGVISVFALVALWAIVRIALEVGE